MKKRVTLLKLYTKSAFMTIPRILLGSVIITALVVLVSFMISKASGESDNSKKITIATVYPDGGKEDKYLDMAMTYLEQEDSVSKVCYFERTSKEEAFEGLKSEKYTAALIIPDNFIEGLMYGDNPPIEAVFLSEGVNNTSMLFRGMLNAGGSDIASAEAGIYATEDLFNTTLRRFYKNRYDYIDELNIAYFAYALDRTAYFATKDLSQKDGLNTIQFYVCTALIMLLLLSGITSQNNLKSDSKALSQVLKTQGIHAIDTGLCKVVAISFIYFIIELIVLLLCMILRIRFDVFGTVITIDNVLEGITSALGLFIVTFSVFSFIYFIFKLINNPVYSVLVLFFVGVIFMFASGMFIPSVLLPKLVRVVGELLPTYHYTVLVSEIIKGTVTFTVCIVNLLYAVVFLGLGSLLEKRKRY